MNIDRANANLKIRRSAGLKPPAPSYSEIKATPNPARHWYHLLLPGIGISIVLVGGGRALFDRLSLPITTIALTQTPAIPVRLTQPKVAKVQDRSSYSANLIPQQSIGIKTQLAGKISKVFVKPGDRVKAGQILFQLTAPQQRTTRVVKRPAIVPPAAPAVKNETTQANEEIAANARLSDLDARKISAQTDIEFNQQEYQKFQQLAIAGAASQKNVTQKLDKLRAAEATLTEIEASIQAEKSKIEAARSSIVPARPVVKIAKVASPADPTPVKTQQYTIAAPFSGIIGNMPIQTGAVVTKQTQLLTIAPTNRVEVKFQLPAARASSLRVGFPVQLIDERDRLLQAGQISAIAPTVDPVTRSQQVKATFTNLQNSSPARVMQVRAIWAENARIVLPTTAISQVAGQNFVFVAAASKNAICSIEGKGQKPPTDELVAAQRPIQLGQKIGTDREILSGLNATDRVIISELPRLKNCAAIVDRSQIPSAPNQTGK